jgi:hypothetical protein
VGAQSCRQFDGEGSFASARAPVDGDDDGGWAHGLERTVIPAALSCLHGELALLELALLRLAMLLAYACRWSWAFLRTAPLM